MNTKQIVAKVKKEWKRDEGIGNWEDDAGVRIRQAKSAKALGDNVVEISGSYFYRGQEGNPAGVFKVYAESLGLNIKVEAVDEKNYQVRPWPKTSWCVQHFIVEEVS